MFSLLVNYFPSQTIAACDRCKFKQPCLRAVQSLLFRCVNYFQYNQFILSFIEYFSGGVDASRNREKGALSMCGFVTVSK